MRASTDTAILMRAPSGADWTACRTLLPEAFADQRPAGALLAVDASTGAAVGGAAFHRAGRFIVQLRVRVLRTFRRRGIGSSLIDAIARMDAAEIHARADAMAEPGAEPFLTANRFALRNRVLTVEAGKEPLFAYLQRVMQRQGFQRKSGGSDFAMVRPADVPRERLARLYTSLIVPEMNLPPGAAAPLVWDSRFAESPVFTVGGEPVGMLLLHIEGASRLCTIVARAVAPEYRQGGWVNLWLLAEGFKRGGGKGATRMRFEAPVDNPDTMKLVARAQGKVTRDTGWFVRAKE